MAQADWLILKPMRLLGEHSNILVSVHWSIYAAAAYMNSRNSFLISSPNTWTLSHSIKCWNYFQKFMITAVNCWVQVSTLMKNVSLISCRIPGDGSVLNDQYTSHPSLVLRFHFSSVASPLHAQDAFYSRPGTKGSIESTHTHTHTRNRCILYTVQRFIWFLNM